MALLIDVRDDTIGEPAASVASLNRAITVWGVDVRKVTIVAIVVAVVALGLLALAAPPHADRPADAGRRRRLRHRAPARGAREHA